MLFNSLEFGILLAITFAVYYLPRLARFQVGILIIASGVFYAWNLPWLLTLLVISILINAVTSYRVSHTGDHKQRTRWAAAGVVLNLTILATFKYLGLFGTLLGAGEWILKIPLPIGISFYTFEGISLLVDCYRRQQNPELADEIETLTFPQHLTKTTLFVAFFPHLIAGPILKARQFYPQIGEKNLKDVDWDNVATCLILGYFLKTVVADNLFDQTFEFSYPYYRVLPLWSALLEMFGYSIQIFADFAGYSLIAIGLGALFGYKLPPNFNFPYMSRSLAEFWRRWHISLSTWLRDYLYFPLGGNRKGSARTYCNLFIVMALGGLWHGAQWGYALWGIYHGLGLALERFLRRDPPETDRWKGKDWLWQIGIFLFVTFGWTFFRLHQPWQVLDFVRSSFSQWRTPPDLKRAAPVVLFAFPAVAYHLLSVGPLAGPFQRFLAKHPSLKAYVLGVLLFAVLVNHGNSNGFIYFQF